MPGIFEPHILRLGGFDSLSTFIFALGKLWADGGLRDLLVDSDVYAGNTVEHMLIGKQFNRAVLYNYTIIHLCRTFDHFEEIHDVFLELSVWFLC